MGFSTVKVANQMGEGGGEYHTGTSALTPPTGRVICAVFAHTAAVVAATTTTVNGVSGTLSSIAIPAGAVWFGRFLSVTPASGTVTVYYSL